MSATIKVNRKKSQYDRIRAIVVKVLVKNFGVTENYIYMILRGEREGEMAEQIRNEYQEKYKTISQSLNS